MGDELSVNQVNETSIASVEELQNLAGGADIKVLFFTIHFRCTSIQASVFAINSMLPSLQIRAYYVWCNFLPCFSMPFHFSRDGSLICFIGFRSCS